MKFVQIKYRLLKFFKRRVFHNDFPTVINVEKLPIYNILQKQTKIIDHNKIIIFGQKHHFKPGCWNHRKKSALWNYNLNYFDFLINGDIKSKKFKNFLIDDWISTNRNKTLLPWDPYPTSIRIVNWIKWHGISNGLNHNQLQSLYIQSSYLAKNLEWHLLGNHIFCNFKALFFAGIFFNSSDSEFWLKKAQQHIVQELEEQILNDGAHFELSPMYHSIILEDVLEIYQVCISSNKLLQYSWREEFIKQLQAAITKMAQWLDYVIHPDGEIPFFNDAAFGVASSPEKLLDLVEELKLSPHKPLEYTQAISSSGCLALERGNSFLIFDVGNIGASYIPGHAHADTLSLEFSYKKDRIFVNSGTSTYQDKALRNFQRSSLAHNNPIIGNFDSSEVWAGFRVARRARVVSKSRHEEKNGTITFEAVHDGYHSRKLGGLVHRRIQLNCSHFEVKDFTNSADQLETRFYFHPDAEIDFTSRDQRCGNIITSSGVCLQFELTADKVELLKTLWYPEFDTEIANQCLVLKGSNNKLILLT